MSDDPADNLRSKMVKTAICSYLVGFLQDGNLDIQLSSIKAITTLATFGRLMHLFGLCED